MGLLNIFSRNRLKKSLSHIKNLVDVALADGQIDNDEMILLLNVAKRLKINDDQIEMIRTNPAAIQFSAPANAKKRFDQIYDLVCMMMVNGHIDPRELELCKALALKLGYMPLIVDDFIKLIGKNIKDGVLASESYKKLLKIAD